MAIQEPIRTKQTGSIGRRAKVRGLMRGRDIFKHSIVQKKKAKMYARVRSDRKIGVWRSLTVNGEKEIFYIDLCGFAHPRNSKGAFVSHSRDLHILRVLGVCEYQNGSSIISTWRLPYTRETGGLSEWSIPPQILKSYHESGIIKLYEWQTACLYKIFKSLCHSGFIFPANDEDAHMNLEKNITVQSSVFIYSAPTSGGKSLVGELFLLLRLIFLGKRAIYVLPYVSICQEKAHYLKHLWSISCLRVETFHARAEKESQLPADVAVSTIERANSLITQLIIDNVKDVSGLGRFINTPFSTVLVDELHMVGDESRGHILESMLIKLMLYSSNRKFEGEIRIVCMSATIPDITVFSKWLLDAQFDVSGFRPIKLRTYIQSGSKIYEYPTPSESRDSVSQCDFQLSLRGQAASWKTPLAELAWTAGGQVLIFCATKRWCEITSGQLTEEVLSNVDFQNLNVNEDVVMARERLVDDLVLLQHSGNQKFSNIGGALGTRKGGSNPHTDTDNAMILRNEMTKLIRYGVFYHHSGLTIQQRQLIENAYRRGVLSIICTTSTLAAGVNLPASRVIIRSLGVGTIRLDSIKVKQMCGRAGRMGYSSSGDAVIVTSNLAEAKEAERLLEETLEPIKSSMYGYRMMKCLLECIYLELITREQDVVNLFTPRLFSYYSIDVDRDKLGSYVMEDILPYLLDNSLIICDNGVYKCTMVGEAIAGSSLNPQEAGQVICALRKASDFLIISSDLHCLFLITPPQHGIYVNWREFYNMYRSMSDEQRSIADLCGVEEASLIDWTTHRPTTTTRDNLKEFHNSIKRTPKTANFHTPRLKSGGILNLSSSAGGNISKDRPFSNKMTIQDRLDRHSRFFAALVLHYFLQGIPIEILVRKFGVTPGSIQQLQSCAASYCGVVASLCNKLRWWSLGALLGSLCDQISAGAAGTHLIPLSGVLGSYAPKARLLFEAGITIEWLSMAKKEDVAALLKGTRRVLENEEAWKRAACEIIKNSQLSIHLKNQVIHDAEETEKVISDNLKMERKRVGEHEEREITSDKRVSDEEALSSSDSEISDSIYSQDEIELDFFADIKDNLAMDITQP